MVLGGLAEVCPPVDVARIIEEIRYLDKVDKVISKKF